MGVVDVGANVGGVVGRVWGQRRGNGMEGDGGVGRVGKGATVGRREKAPE
jgi:hypothetical protein